MTPNESDLLRINLHHDGHDDIAEILDEFGLTDGGSWILLEIFYILLWITWTRRLAITTIVALTII
jgi:hypothetical protein